MIATLAHNLLRWITQIGLGARGELVVAKTLRRSLLALPGRITRSARRYRLHLPADWPWAAWFDLALGCAASPTPPDHRCRTAPALTPDRASASMPGHARPAARVLRIASNRPPYLWIMFQHTHNPVQTGPPSAPSSQEFGRRWIQA